MYAFPYFPGVSLGQISLYPPSAPMLSLPPFICPSPPSTTTSYHLPYHYIPLYTNHLPFGDPLTLCYVPSQPLLPLPPISLLWAIYRSPSVSNTIPHLHPSISTIIQSPPPPGYPIPPSYITLAPYTSISLFLVASAALTVF
jgi:hypothetical protein